MAESYLNKNVPDQLIYKIADAHATRDTPPIKFEYVFVTHQQCIAERQGFIRQQAAVLDPDFRCLQGPFDRRDRKYAEATAGQFIRVQAMFVGWTLLIWGTN